MERKFGTFVSEQDVKYAGDAVPMHEIRLGTVFFATGMGFGIVYKHCTELFIVRGLTFAGEVFFLPKAAQGVYECRPKLLENSLEANKLGKVACGPCVSKLFLLGEVSLPLETGTAGAADFEVAEIELQKFINNYNRTQSCAAQFRIELERDYDVLRVNTNLTESARTFEPSKSELLCVLRYVNDNRVSWYYRQRTGKFFSCSMEVEIPSDDLRGSADDAAVLRAVYEAKNKAKLTKKRVIEVNALTDSQAEEVLRSAVQQGRLSSYVYNKYFGADADMKYQIAVRIPMYLKKLIDGTGLTIESILEKGCEAFLKEVQKELESSTKDKF